jgi:hypothetical protein
MTPAFTHDKRFVPAVSLGRNHKYMLEETCHKPVKAVAIFLWSKIEVDKVRKRAIAPGPVKFSRNI